MAAPPTTNTSATTPLDQALAKGGERPLKLYPVEEDAPRLGHAASRSAADRLIEPVRLER